MSIGNVGAGAAASAGMGLATGGISPLIMAALTSFGPALLSKLFGGKTSAQKEREQMQQKLAYLYSPAYRQMLQSQYYQQNLASPAYSQAQGTIAAGGNQAAGQLASQIGQTGLRSSGTGAIMSSVVPSMMGHQLSGLRTTAYNAAGGAADQSIEGQVRALMGTPSGGPSQGQQLLGAGMDAFGPLLTSWLKNKYPQLVLGR